MTGRIDISLVLASARVGVGVLLIAAPTVVLPRKDAANGTNALLLRTVGVRDLVLGGGAVLARTRGRREEFRRWASAGLASDAGDLLAGICSARLVGRSGAIKAVAVVVPWVAAGAADFVRTRPDGTRQFSAQWVADTASRASHQPGHVAVGQGTQSA
ncbi:hypothetical protein ACFVKB_42395 [Rhodococcus sp. NPDC127530]|jgi:hypothetical protein|uniref:hypothetical protein n=1 Tax=unclassified Rhodococcus (in: high G+C Gram-positive bacteria) TaxID=192944 RepID=UPI00362F45F4